MKKLLVYLRPYKKEVVISPLFKFLEAIFDLLVPLVVARIIDVGIARSDKPYVLGLCGILVGFAAVGLLCAGIAQYFAARAAVGFPPVSAAICLLTFRSFLTPRPTVSAPLR